MIGVENLLILFKFFPQDECNSELYQEYFRKKDGHIDCLKTFILFYSFRNWIPAIYYGNGIIFWARSYS